MRRGRARFANDVESMDAMKAAELVEKPGMLNLRAVYATGSNSSKLILNTSMCANHIPSQGRCESRELE